MLNLPESPVSVYSHPYRPELSLLRVWLITQSYHPLAVETIVSHAAAYDTLHGLVDCQWLDASDEAEAEAVFVGGMLPVSHCSAEWEDPGIWIDLDSYEAAIERYARERGESFGEFPRPWTPAEKAETVEDVAKWFRLHQ